MSEEVTGYDALNFDGLERRGNYRFIAFREDMLHALDKKDAAAILYQIVFRWQKEYKREEVLRKIEERKKSGQKPYTQEEVEDMMFVYMSYNDFVHETGGAIGYNTVIRTLDYLVDKKKALKQRPNHDPKYPDYEYSVNKEVVRELLKALPPDPAFAPKIPKKKNSSTQMGTPDDESTQMGTGSTQTGIPSTQMGTEVYPNGGTSQELTGTHNEHTEEGTFGASFDSAALTQLQNKNALLEARLEEALKQIEAMRTTPPEPGSVTHTPAGSDSDIPLQTICYPFEEHPFIGVDDKYHPTVMIVTLTPAFPHPYWSEMEDKRRERIAAWEILPMYKKQGLEVQVHWRHEQERETVVDSSTVPVGGNHHTLESSVECEKQGVVEAQPPTTLPIHTQAIVASTGRQETASEKEDTHEDRAHSMDSRDGDLDNLSRHPDTHSATDLRQDASSAVVGNNHLDGTAGDTRSGVATGVTNENLRDGETIGAEPTQGTANEKLRDNSYSPNLTTKPAIPATEPPAKPARNRSGKGAGKEKQEKPQLSDEEKAKEEQYAERRRFWQNKINERRGGPLRTRGLCINETECLNTLVREFDDIDIGRIDRHLATAHWKYKKNPAEIGGKALLDESRPTLQYLKTHGGQSSNGSSERTPTPIRATMTCDEARKLAHDAIQEAKLYDIDITAQAETAKNDAWVVRVKWNDGSKEGLPFSAIKVREEWKRILQQMRKMAAKNAERAVRMMEAK